MVSDFERDSRDAARDDPDGRDRQSVTEIPDREGRDIVLNQVRLFHRKHPGARQVDDRLKRGLGVLPISVIPIVAREALSPPEIPVYQTRLVGLPPGTVLRQMIDHPEVTAADYRRVPDLIRTGAIELRGEGHELAFYQEYDGVWFRAIVRQMSGGELELTGLHAIGRDLLPDAVRAARLLDLDEQDDLDDPEIKDALDATSRLPGVVALSARTMLKQQERHPELTTDEYRLLPDLIEHGEVEATPDRRRLVITGEFHGRRYRAVVAQTSAGRLYLIGFHRMTRRPRRRSGARPIPDE